MAYQQNSPDQKDYKLNKQQSSLSLIQSFFVLVVEPPALHLLGSLLLHTCA